MEKRAAAEGAELQEMALASLGRRRGGERRADLRTDGGQNATVCWQRDIWTRENSDIITNKVDEVYSEMFTLSDTLVSVRCTPIENV